MASSQGPGTAAYRAGAVARRLEHSWIGPEHVLLALFDEPSTATQALEELGVSREQVGEAARAHGRSDPPPTTLRPREGPVPNPAWYKLTGCARAWPWARGTIGPSRSTSSSR